MNVQTSLSRSSPCTSCSPVKNFWPQWAIVPYAHAMEELAKASKGGASAAPLELVPLYSDGTAWRAQAPATAGLLAVKALVTDRFARVEMRHCAWEPAAGAPALDPDGVDLLKRLLRYAPHERISARDACAHKWFDDYEPARRDFPKPTGDE